MSKKFSKTILSSAVAGLMFVSFSSLSAKPADRVVGNYTIKFFGENGEQATISDKSGEVIRLIDTTTGSSYVYNDKDKPLMENGLKQYQQVYPNANPEELNMVVQYLSEKISFPVYSPTLKLDSLTSASLQENDILSVKSLVDEVKSSVSLETKDAYLSAINSGGDAQTVAALAKIDSDVTKEYARISGNIDQLNKDTTFAIDADGNITLDETAGTGERYGVKDVVAEVVEDTTVRVAEDGSLTTARNTQTTKRVNEAVVDLDKSVRTNSQDIATNRKAIQSNSRQLQEHNARLNDHQRQIRENHEEMKRAAAQSAALAGLFQPYSVGKFNATAALGGYSDKQAVAVGVGYRFSEQTAAKAGIAASDGDVSYNVG
ncbi:YadA C-terminal domain-containing protein, partial [Escherichia coli]|uniref:YadA C-terminal domain-containing protein n=1 Tax=Escherichia coli TaxID=562 RepID=UPI000BE50D31